MQDSTYHYVVFPKIIPPIHFHGNYDRYSVGRDFVLYILPLGLVRQRTFRLSTWVSLVQTWAQVLTRGRGGCVVHRCQNKNPREVDQWMWMTSCTGSARGGFWGFWKSQFSWVLRSEEGGWLSLARSGLVAGATRVGVGADGKAIIERLCLFSLCPKTFKLKGNKRFRTWTKKSLRVFHVSGFLCSMYICYEHSMYVSHIRISGYVKIESHHHHVVPPAQISLTLSRQVSLSFIASGRSSGLHPVSSHSCCM